MTTQWLDIFGVDGFPSSPIEWYEPDDWFGVDGWADPPPAWCAGPGGTESPWHNLRGEGLS